MYKNYLITVITFQIVCLLQCITVCGGQEEPATLTNLQVAITHARHV